MNEQMNEQRNKQTYEATNKCSFTARQQLRWYWAQCHLCWTRSKNIKILLKLFKQQKFRKYLIICTGRK